MEQTKKQVQELKAELNKQEDSNKKVQDLIQDLESMQKEYAELISQLKDKRIEYDILIAQLKILKGARVKNSR